MDTKISVIIPVYNREDYLKDCVDSVINQTFGFENIELILVDNKSTDNTSEVIKSYAEKYENIVPIFREFNSGSPNTPRNQGLKIAKSKYVMFLDSDDEYAPDMCENFYYFIENNDLDFVRCDYGRIKKNKIKSYIPPISSVTPEDLDLVIFDASEKTLNNTPWDLWSKIYKRSFLLKHDITFPSDNISVEDVYFAAKIYRYVQKWGYINYFGYYWSENWSSLSYTSASYFSHSFMGTIESYNILKNESNDFQQFALQTLPSLALGFMSANMDLSEKNKLLTENYWLFKKFNAYYRLNGFKKIHMMIFSSNINVAKLMISFFSIFRLRKIINNKTIRRLLYNILKLKLQ
ncbi:MAG: glycosyltransferase family 2 protein [Methanobrevibacter sp.]|jgi:glycosyltransferase involved in cell wall biosynthesis|nr:glycosyltransferase family 2 protein [Candidatus Methanoflexus mossambicus]